MTKGVIYGIIDPKNNQLRYIGQTINFKKRKSAHYRTAINKVNNTYVYNWLRTIYNENLKPIFIILEECEISELDELEIFYIDYFSYIGCNLTNSSEGGKSRRGFKQSEEMKQKISTIMKGNSWNKGRKISEETRLKMSIAYKNLKHNQSSKDKVSKANIKHKAVIQLSKNDEIIKVFTSAYEASKELNINRKSIGNVLAGRTITAGNYKWKYV